MAYFTTSTFINSLYQTILV